MEPYYSDASIQVLHGDCLQVLPELPDNSVDAVCTDPPYGLEFMGKDWDSFRQSNRGPQDMAFKDFGAMPSFSPNRRNQKCPKCNKWAYDHPGRKCECGGWKQPAQKGYSLAFQAWCEQWAAECLRILKPGGHMLAFGGTRTWHRLTSGIEDAGFEIRDSIAWLYGSGFPKSRDVSKAIDAEAGAVRESLGVYASRPETTRGMWGAADPESDNYDGSTFGTGERHITAPATPEAAQWQGWGTALKPAVENLCVARKPLSGTVAASVLRYGTGAINANGCQIQNGLTTEDRWPPNVALDEYMAAELNASAPDISPAKFMYVAKASSDERVSYTKPDGTIISHATVKPLSLMRWLVRLVCPPGGTILEPFAGSGTTVEAAFLEGFRCIAIEREADYLPLITQRINRRRDPIAYITAAGDDLGLFGEDTA